HVVLGGGEPGGRLGRRVRRVGEIFHRGSVSIESWPLPAAKTAEDDRDDPHFPSRILAWAIGVPVSEYGVVQTVEPVRCREMRFDCDLGGGIRAPRPKRSVLGNR